MASPLTHLVVCTTAPFFSSPAGGRGDSRASAAGEGVPQRQSEKTPSPPGRRRGRLSAKPRLSPSPACGRGRYSPDRCARISRSTSSIPVSTCAFQNRSTFHPCAFRNAVRRASATSAVACCEPSSSITSRAATQAKSATSGPMLCCRRNLWPINRRSRSCCHNRASASGMDWRNGAACGLTIRVTRDIPEA